MPRYFFVKLWDKVDTYRIGEKHKKWLVIIARNMAVDHIRKHKNETLEDKDFIDIADKKVMENEICTKIDFDEALKFMDQMEKEIVTLKLLCDLTYKDISVLINKPIGTVSWKYGNAIKKLRRYI